MPDYAAPIKPEMTARAAPRRLKCARQASVWREVPLRPPLVEALPVGTASAAMRCDQPPRGRKGDVQQDSRRRRPGRRRSDAQGHRRRPSNWPRRAAGILRLVNIQPLLPATFMEYVPADFDAEQEKRASAALQDIVATVALPKERLSGAVRVGGIYHEILAEAAEWRRRSDRRRLAPARRDRLSPRLQRQDDRPPRFMLGAGRAALSRPLSRQRAHRAFQAIGRQREHAAFKDLARSCRSIANRSIAAAASD